MIKQKYDARLPATPCTEALRKAMEEFVSREHCSLAEAQRAAFGFFLENFVTDSNKIAMGSADQRQEQPS